MVIRLWEKPILQGTIRGAGGGYHDNDGFKKSTIVCLFGDIIILSEHYIVPCFVYFAQITPHPCPKQIHGVPTGPGWATIGHRATPKPSQQ